MSLSSWSGAIEFVAGLHGTGSASVVFFHQRRRDPEAITRFTTKQNADSIPRRSRS